jgi:hypothetical protein
MKNRIILIGDLHNLWHAILAHIVKYDISGAIFIHVGDFPMGFHKNDVERLNDLNGALVKSNNKLLLVRGNHDDPDWYKHENHINEKNKLSNITFVQDYDTHIINDEKWLFIGGAVSPDRKRRMKESDIWFMDEKFVLDEDKLKNEFDIKWVVTHSAPHFCTPQGLGGFILEISKNDIHLLEDVKFERDQLNKAFGLIKVNNPEINGWFYGHFHRSAITDHDGYKFRCLDICEFYEIR